MQIQLNKEEAREIRGLLISQILSLKEYSNLELIKEIIKNYESVLKKLIEDLLESEEYLQ